MRKKRSDCVEDLLISNTCWLFKSKSLYLLCGLHHYFLILSWIKLKYYWFRNKFNPSFILFFLNAN